MSRRRLVAPWSAYLVAGAVLCLLYVFVAPFKGSGPVMNLLGLSPVLAILTALRLHGRGDRAVWQTPWAWFAIGLLLFWCGDLYTYSYPLLLHREVPFPSTGDAAYILVYPALMAGLLLLARRRSSGRDMGGTVDAAILTLGLALPSWVALIAPYLHDGSLSPLARIVSVAYPMGDVLLLAAAVRLALGTGRRGSAFFLLSSSIVLLLATDFVYGVMILNGTYDHQLWLDIGWIGFYLLWGAAALHPTMPQLSEPEQGRTSILTPFRLSLLTGASLIAPAIGLVRDIHQGDFDYAVIRVASLVLFGLVIVRMAGLVRQQERSLARERMLSEAGSALVAATTREAIDRVAADAARDLAGPKTSVLVCSVDGDHGVDVVSDGEPRRVDPSLAMRLVLASGSEGRLDLAKRDLQALGIPAEHKRGLAVPIPARRTGAGLLVVAGEHEPAQALQELLRTLANQVALAIDREDMSGELHRRRSEARFGSLVKHASDLITVVGTDGVVSYQSPSIQRVLGWKPEDIVGTRFDLLVTGADGARLLQMLADASTAPNGQTGVFECPLRHRDENVRQFEVLYTNLTEDEHVRGIVLNSRDISERRAFEEQLTHQAFHDPVTGLANRALFVERVRHALARGRREGGGLAVVFLDLDDFKTINDSLGHAAGVEVLVEVSKRLATSIRASDTAARFGGDEFALLLEDIEDVQEAADTAERVIDALAAPLRAAHKELAVRCSVGISVVEGDRAAVADELIRDADAAMYIAKRDGKGGYRMFEPAMHEGVLARLELRADLQRAIATEQLELHYQPIVRLADGNVSGVEALLRWHHPERGTVLPDQFIPLAEDTGLIVPIGRWVLREGCRHARRMLDELGPGAPVTMSINLSIKQLQHSDIVADVRDALSDAGIPAHVLTLEITETVLMADTELAVKRLLELKELGVRLALDDFGTGYSSLSYLSRFPVDILKMDRSFLREGASPEANGLATAVLALGATLSLEVVAEGIELSEQWQTLRDLGCKLGQGFLFARPMDAEASLAFLAEHVSEGVTDPGLTPTDAP
jgi:diguanylate cyclase (GGDEF)-like protein/PAS domain S-box-containing protein